MPSPLPGKCLGRAGPVLGTLLLSLCLQSSCTNDNATSPTTGNRAPRVQKMEISPRRAHARERILVSVFASDPDNDRMSFTWRASRGTFPEGYRSSAVRWLTPDERGTDSLWVEIGDLRNITRDTLVVTLVPLAPPESLSFRPAGASLLHLKWKASLDHTPNYTVNGWQGYEVFRATRSFAEIDPATILDYRITPIPVPSESLGIMDLRPGILYYFRTRAVRSLATDAGGTWVERSTLAPETSAYCRPEGIADMREFDSPSGRLALDLSENGAVRSLDPNNVAHVELFDLFVGTSSSAGQGQLFLKSVSLLREINPAWSGQQTGIKPVGTNWGILTTTDEGWSEEAALVEGQIYALKLPDGHYAKIGMFDEIHGHAPYRNVALRWAYQAIPNYLHF